MRLTQLFSENYDMARERFRAAAKKCGAALFDLQLDATAPDGTSLSIDIAVLGSRNPQRAVLHSSGLHGVEGYAGAAIQCALLERRMVIPSNGAIILVHALNPYGMAWLRRFNENNVDLNRNFIARDSDRYGVSDGYRRLESLLNPKTPPRHDFFLVQALYCIVRYGRQHLRQAIAEGQYECPNGLFFGGKTLEQGPTLYMAWLKEHLADLEYLFALDVHTGLGKSGEQSLFLRSDESDPEKLSRTLDRHLIWDHKDSQVGYKIRGHHAAIFEMAKENLPFDFLTQEFGTYHSVRTLYALREENRWHHYGGGTVFHPTKKRLKECFAPESGKWREKIVEQGLSLLDVVQGYTFRT